MDYRANEQSFFSDFNIDDVFATTGQSPNQVDLSR
jgi:hypothetical protein